MVVLIVMAVNILYILARPGRRLEILAVDLGVLLTFAAAVWLTSP